MIWNMKVSLNKPKAMMVAVNAKYVHTNIAVRYISRYCKNQGIDCDYCEFTINEPKSSVLAKLYEMDICIYGFSCYIWNIDYVLHICQSLKKLKPQSKIILGGPEVSFDAERLLERYDFVDYIICGEGELASANLLQNFPDSRCVIYGEKSDMDKLPFPYSDEDLEKTVQGEKLVYYETSRGCLFNCAYCLSSMDMGVRYLDLERTKAEIKHLVESGAMTIKFVDRTFNAQKHRASELWKYCMSLDGDTCFHFEIGADLLDDELIDILKAAKPGQFQFEIGVQTTNKDSISEISRKMDMEKLSKNVKRLREDTNVMLHLDLIAGLPYEDFESFKKSFNEVYALSPHVLQLGFLKLLKGSPLRMRFDKYGMQFSDFAPYEIFSTDWLSYDEVIRLKAIEDVLERYFNSGRFYGTLSEVICCFNTPFDFYEKLSKYWQAHQLVGQGVKRISLYSHLYEFLKDEIVEDKLKPIMLKMKEDFSKWHSNGVGTPQWYKMF